MFGLGRGGIVSWGASLVIEGSLSHVALICGHVAPTLLWCLYLQLTPCLCKMFGAISWEFCSLMLGTYFLERVIIRDTC